MEDYFLRLPQVLDYVGVSKPTIYRWIKEKTFPEPIKLSTRMAVWKKADVQEWMRKKWKI
jgi:prophage regulatory protein